MLPRCFCFVIFLPHSVSMVSSVFIFSYTLPKTVSAYPFYCVVSSSYWGTNRSMHQLMVRSRGGAVVLVKSGRARPRLGASSASASSSPALTSLHPLSGREETNLRAPPDLFIISMLCFNRPIFHSVAFSPLTNGYFLTYDVKMPEFRKKSSKDCKYFCVCWWNIYFKFLTWIMQLLFTWLAMSLM